MSSFSHLKKSKYVCFWIHIFTIFITYTSFLFSHKFSHSILFSTESIWFKLSHIHLHQLFLECNITLSFSRTNTHLPKRGSRRINALRTQLNSVFPANNAVYDYLVSLARQETQLQLPFFKSFQKLALPDGVSQSIFPPLSPFHQVLCIFWFLGAINWEGIDSSHEGKERNEVLYYISFQFVDIFYISWRWCF